ncbi:MAG TPA: glucose-6-phosphate isomerase family protein [Rhizomicrobium sp.]|nr:glucose-6-phosphate isomerase family protein [Rhizomicrobium sp.]
MSAATLQSLATSVLLGRFDPVAGTIEGARRTERRLSDLSGMFLDEAAYQAARADDDRLVYSVEAVEPGTGEGDLHYGIGVIYPGRIGREYFMTKGHLHSWREAAELYVGLSGNGVMLLEDEATGESRMLPLASGCAVYVPGHTGHRTANVGDTPLSYIGIYPARAGHDYGVYASRNFRCAIVDHGGEPKLIRRDSVGS